MSRQPVDAAPVAPRRIPDALADCVGTFRKYLYLPDPGALYLTMAAIVANRGEGDPVWLLLVGPPGSGKTETLGPLSGEKDCYPAATITEASLLSGTSLKECAPDAQGGLLREMGEFGIIVAKDFTSVLSMHRDARAAVLAALREIYDGAWTRHVGTSGGRKLAWSGKVGFIAGCTEAIDSHHSVMSTMGERFVMYRLPPVDGAEQARRALDRGNDDSKMRAELQAACHAVLVAAGAARSRDLDPTAVDRLVTLAQIATRCRSAVERNSYTHDIELIPAAEAPARVALALRRVSDGLDAIGVHSNERWRLLVKVALDSVPVVRVGVLNCLIQERGPMTTKEVASATRYSEASTRRTLEDLHVHGVLDRQRRGKADQWVPSTWLTARWWATGVVPGMSDAPETVTVPEMSVPDDTYTASPRAT